MIECFNLSNNINFIDDVVDMIFEEWGDLQSNNRNFWESWVKSSLSENDVPMTYIVKDKGILIGTFSFWRCDLQSRQDLFPWLGGIVVKKEFRGKGYGLEIQKLAKRELIKLPYKVAYLFTETTGFYEKTGWKYIENIPDEKGMFVRLYKLVL